MTPLSHMTLETPRKIETGDAGLVLTHDGNYFVFNTHESLDPENLTERQIEQGRVIEAFMLALRFPQVMNVLFTMVQDPNVVQQDVSRSQMN